MKTEDRRPQGTVQIALRISPDLRERVKAAADANNRSVNSELTSILEEKYPAPDRWFNIEKWNAHSAKVKQRSEEIINEIKAITAAYSSPQSTEQLQLLAQRLENLSDEHDRLFDYSIEDDCFYDTDASPTPDDD